MARIWRDGQTKPVVIYRLLSRGSIEEKIYQRQIAKDEVAAQVTGAPPAKKSAANQRHFSKEELREHFTLRTVSLSRESDRLEGGDEVLKV
jgi:SNF2 family DNA or RNA helicase